MNKHLKHLIVAFLLPGIILAARRYTSLTRLKAYVSDERESNSLACAMYIKNDSDHIVKRYQSINN